MPVIPILAVIAALALVSGKNPVSQVTRATGAYIIGWIIGNMIGTIGLIFTLLFCWHVFCVLFGVK